MNFAVGFEPLKARKDTECFPGFPRIPWFNICKPRRTRRARR